MRTLGALVAGALVGLVGGAAGVLTHTSWWWLAVALAGLATGLLAAPGAARVGLAAGWAVAVGRASLERPEGDYLVSAGAQGWTFLGCSLLLVVAGLVSAALGAGHARDLRLRGVPS